MAAFTCNICGTGFEIDCGCDAAPDTRMTEAQFLHRHRTADMGARHAHLAKIISRFVRLVTALDARFNALRAEIIGLSDRERIEVLYRFQKQYDAARTRAVGRVAKQNPDTPLECVYLLLSSADSTLRDDLTPGERFQLFAQRVQQADLAYLAGH